MTIENKEFIREATCDDLPEISDARTRFGFRYRAPEDLERTWKGNPTAIPGADTRIGWVAESAGRIVGFLGSSPARYQLGNRVLNAAITRSYFVEPEYRRFSLSLLGRFFQQPGVELFVNSTANTAASPLFKAFKAKPWPYFGRDMVHYRVVRPVPFLRAAFTAREFPPMAASVASVLLAPLLSAQSRRIEREKDSKLETNLITVEEIGPEFDRLWERRLRERPQLFCWRSSEMLRWFWGNRSSQNAKVIVCRGFDRLLGYAVIEASGTIPSRAKLIDVFVEKDDAKVIRALFAAANLLATELGNYAVEVVGLPENVFAALKDYKLRTRKLNIEPILLKARTIEIQQTIETGDWYRTLYDGDELM